MHIAWVNLTSGGMSGGYKKYLREILPRLSAHPNVTRLNMLSPAGTVPHDLSRAATTHTEWARGDGWQGFKEARRLLRGLRPDVVYIPTARWVGSGGLPTVVMVQNMEPLIKTRYSNPWFERAVNVARRRAASKACANATRIIAVSDFVHDFLTYSWGIPAAKVARVYFGVDVAGTRSTASRPKVLEAMGADDSQFLFIAGSVRPMRGIEDGILALADLKDTFPSLRLVIAGALEGRVEQWAGTLRSLVFQHELGGRVVWTGKLSAAEMAWCFKKCGAFLMTSRVEACPNTALEAMQGGAVTISTRNPPMPEFFAEAALYYEAGNVVELANQISSVLRLPRQELSRLRGSGTNRARNFTWEKCAEDTLNELVSVAGSTAQRVSS